MKAVIAVLVVGIVVQLEIFLVLRLDSLNLQTWAAQAHLNQSLIDAYENIGSH